MPKTVIYQTFPRYFGNTCLNQKPFGGIEENGCGKFKDYTAKALHSIREMGVTHIWYTGILEHATKTDYSDFGILRDHPAVVKGQAGSPYAVKDYYDVDPDLAVSVPDRLKEFQNLVRRTHQAGMKVIIDFVPNHLARRYHSDQAPAGESDFGANDNTSWAFAPNNNFYYLPDQTLWGQFDMYAGHRVPYQETPAKVTGNDCFSSHPGVCDWYETVKLNYGVDYQGGRTCHFDPIPDTWKRMHNVLTYWASMGVDGFRCDMAEMVPSAFWAWVTESLKKKYKGLIFIGEVYNPGLYREYIASGFDYLYDKVGLYDKLKAIVQGKSPACELTQCWQQLGDIQPHMLNFLENHDEQRIASDFFAGNARRGLPALVVSACLNTNPFMLYQGQELGEKGMWREGFSGRDGRSTIFDYWGIPLLVAWNDNGRFDETRLDADSRALRQYYSRLLNLCQSETALSEGLFFDLTYVNMNHKGFDPARQYAFLRKSGDSLLLIVANFGQSALVQVRVPEHAFDYLQLDGFDLTQAVDLLRGDKQSLPLSKDGLTVMQVPGNDARIWKYQRNK